MSICSGSSSRIDGFDGCECGPAAGSLSSWRTELPWRYCETTTISTAFPVSFSLLTVILRHPETQATSAGGSRTFVCTAQGDVLWYIDDRWLSSSYQSTLEGKGFTFQEVDLSGYQYTTTNLTMTVPARGDLNGTEIYCETAGSDGILVSSTHSWLRIVGMAVATFSLLGVLCSCVTIAPQVLLSLPMLLWS